MIKIKKPASQPKHADTIDSKISSSEEIRNETHKIYLNKLARKIYHNRIKRGMYSISEKGSPEQDSCIEKAISELQAMGY